MADNVTIPTTGTGTATPVIATDDVGGVHYQRVKLDGGGDGAAIPLVATALADGEADPTTLRVGAMLYARNPNSNTWFRVNSYDGNNDTMSPFAVGSLAIAYNAFWDGSNWVRWHGNQSRTATLANVASSASSVTLLASNAGRIGAVIANDSTSVLYVKFGTTASATSFTYKLLAGDTLELPVPTYTGRIDGIWVSANGNARTTEMT